MAIQEYNGSCHCGNVKYKVQLDLAKGTGRCNCTFCTKSRWWGAMVMPQAFQLISGLDSLSDYTKSKPFTFKGNDTVEPNSVHHLFCKNCGVRAFGRGHIPELGGEYYSVNIACLDNVDFKEVMQAPMQYFDGRTNNWFQTPEYTAHL